ncbi:hypothetical protein QCMSULEJ_CDS0071 [Escherichia phage KS_W4]|nr:MAG TPA: hypothetical protein [Caudoviricetes sp.]
MYSFTFCEFWDFLTMTQKHSNNTNRYYIHY